MAFSASFRCFNGCDSSSYPLTQAIYRCPKCDGLLAVRHDLKALAKLTGDRKVETVALKEVQPLTGYIRGGVTALAGKKDYPVFVDETLTLYDIVAVSAGIRGTQLVLAPADYLRATKGRSGPIARPKSR